MKGHVKIKGFWNITQPMLWATVNYTVLAASVPTHWQNAFIGQVRQGILIKLVDSNRTGKDESFLIDNQDGSGYYKVIKMGAPNIPHRSLSGEVIIDYSEINSKDVKRELDEDLMYNEREIFLDFLKNNHPEGYKDYLNSIETLKKITNGTKI